MSALGDIHTLNLTCCIGIIDLSALGGVHTIYSRGNVLESKIISKKTNDQKIIILPDDEIQKKCSIETQKRAYNNPIPKNSKAPFKRALI